MFKKPLANLKTFSPLRSSDRRRFQTEAYEAYPLVKEICTAEGGSPLMPDDLRSAKFISHSGTSGKIYMSGKQVLFISLEKLPPIPTVYTLWQYPSMLPKLYTWDPVINKLMEGADLMIPGLVPGPDGTLPQLETGDLVAITIKGYAYPLAVGTMALPTSDIKPRSGMKGKAVHIIHVYEDYLWAMGDKSAPPELKKVEDDGTDGEGEEEQEDISNNDNNTENSELINSEVAIASTESTEIAQSATKEQDTKAELKTNEIDEWLKKSLYHALVHKIKADSHSNILPLSGSSLYSSYIMPCRPLEFVNEVDIKKSSWKKLQKFLKTMEKAGLLKTKEQRGETMITSINYSHPSLQNLQPYRTMEAATTAASQSSSKENRNDIENTSKSTAHQKDSQQPEQAEIQELYKPLGEHLTKFFEEAKYDAGQMYTIPEVRQVLTDYIKINNLADSQNQKMININPTLCDIVLSKQEYHSVQKLARDQLLNRLCSKMQHFHTIKLPGKEPILRKGSPKPIEITQEIRQGRKTITKVTGMEAFDLDVDELSKELTRLCASSATYNPIAGVSPKNPLMELMVQGPQIKLITKLMINKGVPKKFIDTFDRTTKKGGKAK
ncbi:hypothetical protein BDF20DRAFT_847680 [Mycotypha africana]|uniref:uncharacterized protein n=1 Tax=Mycotypha africana TaxID=64632 RepID=UPI0023016317|nr:uncharacterized protein BDF20DRAFT_847680 [Mycotypha africana]KAI8991996.1 hypothetical protein BDF20DRAFT_847680 [Mycotypha africana]